ncbi:hypothetical protein AD952_12775 [Acetobacter cerevisiae]|uniref:DUF262 domain-containing protein n=1 Tax=Acetobacter cerevisiae TaxID=178900 RepID=A0A149URQ3_9PROT|nr:DUF262 domain-containing protein [Acetobacter cerevisiae]KXV70493.1 hypothetical protein AD952_12775 [Acetobacter cerevisiae]
MSQQNSIVLKSIDEILTESFFIPFYQRGYRWTKRQAEDLLDDIYEFQRQKKAGSGTPFYCLQPVVVKKRDQEWELIDGQQRLTTIHILLNYLKDQMTPGQTPYQIVYQTRPTSQDFLAHMSEERSKDNIDFFHMYEVRKTIEGWFELKEKSCKSEFLHTLLGHDDASGCVKIIWYQINEITDVTTVFKRLNMGKIPLTNAELVKALLLKRSNFQEQERHLQQLRIAQEWDSIERSLQADDFWYFLNEEAQDANRIELILRLTAHDLQGKSPSVRPDDPSYIFLTFSHWLETTESPYPFDVCWEKIYRSFMMLHEWYQDRELFHLIGFLIASGKKISDIQKVSKQSVKKSDFKKNLKAMIRIHVIPEDQKIDFYIEKLSYEDRVKVVRVLLLFNITSLLFNRVTNARFQFDHYKMQKWDLEHIHSRMDTLPDQKKKQSAWLENTLDFIKDSVLLDQNAERERLTLIHEAETLKNSENFKTEFPAFAERIINLYGRSVDKSGTRSLDKGDSIGNLTLLDSATNRSYQNAIFPIKRKDIIALDKSATFVPLCTKNVFLKYYRKNVTNMQQWDITDMENYQSAIINALKQFFDEQGNAA